MWQGILEEIWIAPKAGAPMQALDSVEAIAGQGLAGDRYSQKEGTFSTKDGPDREVTLIDAAVLESFAVENNIRFGPADARRNLVTRGVPLNDLIDQVFEVGHVQLKGLRLCEPCDYLQKWTGQAVLPGLVHRGGLRAQILRSGTLHCQDAIHLA